MIVSSPTKYVVPCYQCATEILDKIIEDTKSGGVVWHCVRVQGTDCIMQGCAACNDGSYEPILELSVGVNIAKLSVVDISVNGRYYVTFGVLYRQDLSEDALLARKFRTLIDLVDTN